MTDTARILTGGHRALAAVGHPLSGELWTSLLWSAAIVAAFAPLTAWRLRRG